MQAVRDKFFLCGVKVKDVVARTRVDSCIVGNHVFGNFWYGLFLIYRRKMLTSEAMEDV